MYQLSLVMLKPDAFEENGIKNRVEEKLYEELKNAGLDIVIPAKAIKMTEKQFEDHYGFTRRYGVDIFVALKEFMLDSGKECYPMVIGGESAILSIRKIIGPTRGATWGLRKTSESAFKQSPRNYVHASGIVMEEGVDPYKEAKEEIKRFFPKEYPNLVKTYTEFFNNM